MLNKNKIEFNLLHKTSVVGISVLMLLGVGISNAHAANFTVENHRHVERYAKFTCKRRIVKHNKRKRPRKRVKRTKQTNRIHKHTNGKRVNHNKHSHRYLKYRYYSHNRKRTYKKRTRKYRIHHVYLRNAYNVGKRLGKKEYMTYNGGSSIGGSPSFLKNKYVFNNKFDKRYINGYDKAAVEDEDDERPQPEVAVKLAKVYQSSNNKMYKKGLYDDYVYGVNPHHKGFSNGSYKKGHAYAENILYNAL